jgi:hypothetical protein
METAVRPAQSRVEVLRESGAALGLIDTVEGFLREMRRVATAFERLRLVCAAEEFLCADEAAREASEQARLVDSGGWGGFDDEAERLDAIAEDAWRVVESGLSVGGVGAGRWARGLSVFDEAKSAGVEYVGRRRSLVGHAVAQTGPVDWSRGRAA